MIWSDVTELEVRAKRIAELERQIVELRVALTNACSALNHYGPKVSHEGPCGPDAGCDMFCMEVADFSELWGRLRTALATTK
jgi:hypothetical protein